MIFGSVPSSNEYWLDGCTGRQGEVHKLTANEVLASGTNLTMVIRHHEG